MLRFNFIILFSVLACSLQSCQYGISKFVKNIGTGVVVTEEGAANVRIAVAMPEYNSMAVNYIANSMQKQGFTVIENNDPLMVISEKIIRPGERLFQQDTEPFIAKSNLFLFDNIHINYILDIERLAGNQVSSYDTIGVYCKVTPPSGFFISGLNGQKVEEKEKKSEDRTICEWSFAMYKDNQQPIQVSFKHINPLPLSITIAVIMLLCVYWRNRGKVNYVNPVGNPSIHKNSSITTTTSTSADNIDDVELPLENPFDEVEKKPKEESQV